MEFKEIFRLKKMLEEAKIPHEIRNFPFGYSGKCGYRLGYPVLLPYTDCVCDVIETNWSYGSSQDKLEIANFVPNEEPGRARPIGHLTAEDVFERIKTHYERNAEHEIHRNPQTEINA